MLTQFEPHNSGKMKEDLLFSTFVMKTHVAAVAYCCRKIGAWVNVFLTVSSEIKTEDSSSKLIAPRLEENRRATDAGKFSDFPEGRDSTGSDSPMHRQ